MSGGVLITVQVQLIDLGGDTADRFAIAIGEEKFRRCMLEIGIVLGIEVEFSFQQKRWHPLRITSIKFERQMVEIMPLAAGADRHDFDGCQRRFSL